MTDPVPSSLLRQEGPQQEKLDLTPIKLRQLARNKIEHLHGSLCLSAFEGQQASDDCMALIMEIDRLRAVVDSSTPDPDLLARLRDYHHQVLQGFRHISRLEEADLIQAAIDGLRQPVKEPVQVYDIVTALLNEHDISDATHGNYDAEIFKIRLGDLWMQRVECVLEGRCPIPPFGWRCTRTPGHDGPCAAVEEQSDLVHPVPPAEGEK